MRRMYSKKQLEELISEMSGDILEVKNVKQLNDEQCNSLKVGDVVAKKTGSQYHLYLVTYKQEKHGLCLSYFDASVVETQSYDYTGGHWIYNSEDKTEFAELGGLTPEQANLLYVRKMDAPASTTLTDEEFAKIIEGVFINGDFLGFHNPVLDPANLIFGNYTGLIRFSKAEKIGIARYTINPTTKVISYSANNDMLYYYPGLPGNILKVIQINNTIIRDDMLKILNLATPQDASTSTYVPKLVNGTWTLVKES